MNLGKRNIVGIADSVYYVIPVFENSILTHMTNQIDIRNQAIEESNKPNQVATLVQSRSAGFLTISVPLFVADKIRQRLPETDYSTVDEYASAVLEAVLVELEKEIQEKKKLAEGSVDRSDKDSESRVFSREEQESVEDRLRGLGYM